MSELRKTYGDGLFYLTFTVVGWVDVFTRPLYTDEIVKSLKFCQKKKGLEISAYIIMTNHLHLIASRADGELAHTIRDFKSFTAKRMLNLLLENPQESRKYWMDMVFKYHAATIRQNEKYTLWQKTNHATELWTPSVVRQKIAYVQENPVRAGFVNEAHDWMLSSACPASPIAVLDY